MTAEGTESSLPRSGATLIRATRPYSDEDPAKTRRLFATTLLAAFAALSVAIWAPHPALRYAGSLLLGLINIRIFIFYHDTLHGAVFRKSRAGKAFMRLYGLVTLTPPQVWKDSHNYHHAHTSKLVGSSIGSFPIITFQMYRRATPTMRFLYRATRHWLTMLTGYVSLFVVGMCLKPLINNPKRNWTAGVSLLLHFGIVAALVHAEGVDLALRAYVVPLSISCAIGSYLFYAQHNFPGMELHSRADWEYSAAALHSSSMMEAGPILEWFTGSIGYHHVHHLNSQIPFYRLEETMKHVPELANPHRTSLAPREIARCLALHVWDPVGRRMLSLRETRERMRALPQSDVPRTA